MPDKSKVAVVTVRGKLFTAFDSLMVRRYFHNGVSDFTFAVAEIGGTKNVLITRGDPVQIALGGVQVIDGFVTKRAVSYDAETHQVVISGKSRTCDVADSSIPVKPGTFDGFTFEQIARSVLQPHSVGLVMRNPSPIASKPFPRMRVQYGETAGDLIQRLAQARGMFVSDDANGNLVVGQGRPNAGPVAELRFGGTYGNILSAFGSLEDTTAFGAYTGISQTASTSATPPRFNSATGTVGGIRPNRTTISIADQPMQTDELQSHLGVQMSTSMWNVVNCTYRVSGWFASKGKLWDVAQNVTVDDPLIFPEGEAPSLGILSVTYQQSSTEGSTTSLELVLPQFLTDAPSYGLNDANGAPAGGGIAPSPPKPDQADYGVNV